MSRSDKIEEGKRMARDTGKRHNAHIELRYGPSSGARHQAPKEAHNTRLA